MEESIKKGDRVTLNGKYFEADSRKGQIFTVVSDGIIETKNNGKVVYLEGVGEYCADGIEKAGGQENA